MRHIKTKIILLTTICILTAALVLGGFSAWQLYTSNSHQLTVLKAEMLSGYDDTIKSATESVTTQLAGIKNQVNAGLITMDEAKIIAADTIRNAKYGVGGYFFVYGLDGMTIVLLGDQAVEGTSRIDLKDANGKMIVQEFIEIANKDGSGFSEYYYPKKGETTPLPKRAYVQLDADFGWIIGTGNYIDDIDTDIVAATAEGLKALKIKMLLTFAISAFIILIGIIAAVTTSATISNPIVRVNKLIDLTAELDVTYDDSFNDILKYKDETGRIAHSVVELRKALRAKQRMLKTVQKNFTIYPLKSKKPLKIQAL